MNKLTHFIKDFIEDESGLTAVEYAIAGGLVVGGMVIAFNNLGDNATNQIDALSCATTGGTWVGPDTTTDPVTPGVCTAAP